MANFFRAERCPDPQCGATHYLCRNRDFIVVAAVQRTKDGRWAVDTVIRSDGAQVQLFADGSLTVLEAFEWALQNMEFVGWQRNELLEI